MAKFKLKTKTKPAPISTFGLGKARKPDPKTHGGKGAGLIRMSNLGLPVPPGFVIQVPNFHDYRQKPEATLKRIRVQVDKALARIAEVHDGPLLYSVRSGAEVSMPGMMDTVLNVGANSAWTDGAWANTSPENARWALDCRRRFLQMFATVVLGTSPDFFEETLKIARDEAKVESDSELTAEQLLWVVGNFEKYVGDIPEDPTDQVMLCVEAVFKSWDNERAIEYRNQNGISHDLGTAVTVQLMVFGNTSEASGSGVAFSRDPSTGEGVFLAEYLANAQGEDVVAGIRTPLTTEQFLTQHQKAFFEIQKMVQDLEVELADMVDVEFTVQDGKMWILQVRPGKRTGAAAFRIARDMIEEGMIDLDEARKRLRPEDFAAATRPCVVTDEKPTMAGLGASPGVGVGLAITTAEGAAAAASNGTPFVWVAHETNPDHIGIMAKAEAVLTEVGGITSHAAVVARGMNKPCVTGCTGAVAMAEGVHTVAVDGNTGNVWDKHVETQEGGWSESVRDLMAQIYVADGSTYVGSELVMSGQVLKCGEWFRSPSKGQGKRALEAIVNGEFTDVVMDVTPIPTPEEDVILATALGNPADNAKDGVRRAKLVEYIAQADLIGHVTLTGLNKQEADLLKTEGYRVVQRMGGPGSKLSLKDLKKAVECGETVKLDSSILGGLSPSEAVDLIPGLKILAPTKTVAQVLGEV